MIQCELGVRKSGRIRLPAAGPGSQALVNKLHARNFIRYIVFSFNLLTPHRSLSRYVEFTFV